MSKLPRMVANITAHFRVRRVRLPLTLHIGIVYQSFTNGAKVAPQNCNFKGCGAYTGEMAADRWSTWASRVPSLASERRGDLSRRRPPSRTSLATKLKYLLDKGMNVILAIGEPLPIRERASTR